jgi:hypothetical protein
VSYVVRKTEEKDQYMIWDKDEDKPIQLSLDKQRANDIARKLNLGSGFEGHIPSFLMVRI